MLSQWESSKGFGEGGGVSHSVKTPVLTALWVGWGDIKAGGSCNRLDKTKTEFERRSL